MDDLDGMAACRYCKGALESGARKCPQCLGWQGRLPDLQSPKGVFVFMGTMCLFMAPMVVAIDALERPAGPEIGDIVVADAELHRHPQDGPVIAVIGKLRNEGSRSGSRPHFEVRVHDPGGELIDAFAAEVPSLVIPPEHEVAFRVRAEAHHDPARYGSFEIHLTEIHGSRR